MKPLKQILKNFSNFWKIAFDFYQNCIHNVYVKIVGKLILQEFWQQHKRAKKPLERWIQVVEEAEWHNFSKIKQTFRTCDVVKSDNRRFVVFDIGGNKYRLVTTVNCEGQIVVIKAALIHSDYDKEKWKD